MSKDNAGLVDTMAYLQVIGCLLKNSTLIDDIDHPLQREDFNTNPFYELLYVSIYNLYMTGAQVIDEYAVDSYLKDFKEQYKIFEENNGTTYLSNARELATLENYELNYHKVRKLSLLRYYEDQGLDTRGIYDTTIVDPKESESEQLKFNSYSEQDIVDKVENAFVLDPKARFCSDTLTENIQAGDGLIDLIESYLESPDYGYSFTSLAFNTICRGARKGKFYLRSAATGTGKTRNFLMDACSFAVPYTYDINKEEFIYTGHSTPTLFVGTEGSLTEFQSIVLATVSGVSESHIIKGQYEIGELERVKQAAKYIEEAPLYLVYCDDYSISDIENIAKRYVLMHGIEIFIFDYLQSSLRLMTEISGSSRVKMQEYQMLIIFSTRLKALAERLDICIISGTQLSAEANDARYKTNLVLQGSKAVANKVDVGAILSKPNPGERKKLDAIVKNMVGMPPVTHLLWIYKCRAGELSSVILCCNINLSNMRMRDCFVCDFDFNVIDIDLTKIETVEQAVKENSIDISESGLRDTLPQDPEGNIYPEPEEEDVVKPKFDW